MNAATRNKFQRELAGLKSLLKGKLTATERKTISGLAKKFQQALADSVKGVNATKTKKPLSKKSKKPEGKKRPRPTPTTRKTTTGTKTRPTAHSAAKKSTSSKATTTAPAVKRPPSPRVRCEGCWELFRLDDLLDVRVGLCDESRCRACAKMFYVLQCEPGREKGVKKALLARFREHDKKPLFGRVIVPQHREVKTFRTVWEVVDEDDKVLGNVRADDSDEAWRLARKETYPARTGKCREKDGAFVKRDDRGELLDVPVIKDVRPTRNERYALRKESSYPGYVVVQMVYDKTTSDALDKIGGAWGLLPPRPKDSVVKIDPRTKRPRNVVLNEKQMMRIKDDRGYDLLYDIQTWRPTALASEEAAMILIQEKEMKVKAPELVLAFAIGDVVRITKGTFEKQEGVVLGVNGDPADPTVKLRCRVMGTPFDIDLHHSSLVKTGKSEIKPQQEKR